MTETRWWWIRHAPVRDHDNRIYGQTDLAADCTDQMLFGRLAGMLPEPAVLVTSDLRRTTETAAAIAGAGLALPDPIQEQSLREQHFGNWQGVRRDSFSEVTGRQKPPFWLAPAFERAPNGESFVDVVARVIPTVTRLTADHAGRDIICVAHGGTIRAALAFALNLDPESALGFSIANCSVTRIDHIKPHGGASASWRVERVNRNPAE